MKRNKSGKRLSDDDLALWRKVTARTQKLDVRTLFTPPVPAVPPDPPALKKIKQTVIAKPGGPLKPKPHSLAPSIADQIGAAPVQMDKKAFTRLKRGKLMPEGRIDLHGMTLDRAHPALNRFILSAHKEGKRLVLVITGKGKQRDDAGPIPVRHGVLRHQVPQWLSTPPLSRVILQVSHAHASHGGGGAYYVYLRRHR